MDQAERGGERGVRRGAAAVAAAALVSALAWVAAPGAGAASAKITICHRTHSTGNPYRRITVSQNAVQNARHGGHGLPAGSTNPAVFDAGWSYAPNAKHWGDVIPGATNGGSAYNGSNSVALNWTAAGQAHFFGATCGAMTAREFYDVEIAAGVPAADVIADLNEQAANEDVALLAALGGSFTAGNLSSWTTAVAVTTGAPDPITSSGATFRGSLTVGSTSTVSGFEYGTDPTLATRVTVTAAPSPVTGTATIAASVGGLSPSTTYYVRAIGTTNAGADTEGVLRGEIVAFTTLAAGATTTTAASTTSTTSTTPAGTTTTSVVSPETSTSTTSATSTTTPGTTTTQTTAAPASTTTTTGSGTTTTLADAAPVASTSTSTTSSTTTTSTTAASSTTTSTTTTSTTMTSTTSPPLTPSTTSTTPTSSPPVTPSTAADPGAPAPLARVAGVVWFDRNANTRIDGREWMLPHVELVLAPLTAPSLERVEVAAVELRTRSAADGSYAFEGVAPGEYVVTAAADIEGFDRTSDTDGDRDWIVRVSAHAGATAVADFAGLGRGHLGGDVIELGTRRGIGGAEVTCRWGGFDDVLGTPDDVPFAVVADEAGAFDMPGVPYGEFSCEGVDPVGGARSSAASASVFGPERVDAQLPVPVLPAAPLAPAPASARELPRTGSSATAALCLVAIGIVLVGGAARRLARRP